MPPNYFVYILASPSRTLYVGVTNDLQRRLFEHKNKLARGFASQYNITRLVYLEATLNIRSPITREKEIKAWRREKKNALIEAANPNWRDLSKDWTDKPGSGQ